MCAFLGGCDCVCIFCASFFSHLWHFFRIFSRVGVLVVVHFGTPHIFAFCVILSHFSHFFTFLELPSHFFTFFSLFPFLAFV